MDKALYHHYYQFVHEEFGFVERECASFPVCLNEEQKEYLLERVSFHNNEEKETSCLYEALDMAIEDFYQKYGIFGNSAAYPFEWTFDV